DGITAEEWGGLIEETGVLDPLRAFTDALTAGMPTVSADFDFILPYADIYKLVKLSRAEFSRNDDKFDRMIENHLKRRSLKQQADIKAIKNIKEKIYDIVHSEVPSNPEEIARYKSQLKNLKLGLTEDYINRLVAWKLNWQFFGFSGLTMGGSERNMRSEVAIEGMLRAEEDGMIPEFDSRGQRLTGINRYRHPNAIRMARLYVYNTMFGMSSQFLPKMFRGAVGKFALQFKSYQYHQLLHDWKYFQNFVASEEKTNPLFTAGNLSIRLTNELGRMLGGRKLGISSKSDITANRLLQFILSRGTASVLSVGMFYIPKAGFIIRKVTGEFGFRGVRGLESPVFAYPMRAIYLALILGVGGDPDDKEAKGALQSFLMDWTPPLMNMLVFLFIDGLKAARPYIPLYNPIGVTVGLGADLILDDY
ncbi:MAG: hypothetical protein KJ604_19995, partial [Gammaproteobacteria bacterium]|nr:hypothetical protein [Gammaproteobacteria bacterium]